jgi:hypothetical protein
MRPVLEVADVFRRHGEAFRQNRGAHLGRVERRVMSAVEQCRTPALGGHTEQCGDCGLLRHAYNSCLMGKISNGESKAALPIPMPLLVGFGSPLLRYPGARRSACPAATSVVGRSKTFSTLWPSASGRWEPRPEPTSHRPWGVRTYGDRKEARAAPLCLATADLPESYSSTHHY